jgi:hypothetical protein
MTPVVGFETIGGGPENMINMKLHHWYGWKFPWTLCLQGTTVSRLANLNGKKRREYRYFMRYPGLSPATLQTNVTDIYSHSQ